MTDVFISYAREDQALAQALANDLKAQGYNVWWDTELVGSDDFYEVILTALTEAVTAIVIWTPNSVKSPFVRDEARYALFKKKLVTVKTNDLDVMDVPFGFQSQHMDPLDDRDSISVALKKLGAKPAPAHPAHAMSWAQLAGSTNIDDLMEFIGACANPEERKQAAARIAELSAAAPRKRIKAEDTSPAADRVLSEVKSLSASNWASFLQGLRLRVPEFQLAEQGFYTSIGVAVGVIITACLLITGAGIAIASFDLKPDVWGGSVGLLGTLPAWYVAYFFAQRFIKSRNFTAGLILGVFLLIITIIVCFFAGIAIWGGGSDFEKSIEYFIALLIAAEIGTIYLLYRSYRKAK